MSPKAGRNDPCPCGSGRKYKQCCLRGTAASGASAARPHYNEGVALQAAGRTHEAADRFRAALALEPGFFEAHVNLGNALRQQGHAEQALACFRRAMQLRPEMAELNLNLALALQTLGRLDEAIASYRATLPLRGTDPTVHNNLGVALGDAGRHAEAMASFQTALALDPQSAVAHFSYARALVTQGRIAEAATGYRRALSLDPTFMKASSGLLLALLYSDAEHPADVWRAHRRFADLFETPLQVATAAHVNAPDPDRRLKIGYVSGDFRNHSVAYFIEPVLAHHDRSQVEVYCYYTATAEDAITGRLREASDHWLGCESFSDPQLADRIRSDGVDLLVDLSGHTGGHRLRVFARKPAPIQLSWIGYPCGTGLRGIDYRLTDRLASPPGSERICDDEEEPLYRLPGVFCCYRPPDGAPDPKPAGDADSGRVTLGSFNNAAKISDSVVRLWSRLLSENPGFRLLLKNTAFADASVRNRAIERFAAHGVDSARLTLVGRLSSEAEHMSLYRSVDIALDTFPYCGVTTTCEALWMGVPVVSLVGESFISRMGLTLLSAVGYPEWAATTEADYVERVTVLAAHPVQRATLRRSLRARMSASPLMDEVGFTRELEASYRVMWRRWCDRVVASEGVRRSATPDGRNPSGGPRSGAGNLASPAAG